MSAVYPIVNDVQDGRWLLWAAVVGFACLALLAVGGLMLLDWGRSRERSLSSQIAGLIDALSDVMVVCDNGVITEVNRGFTTLTGWEPNWAVGLTLASLVRDDAAAEWLRLGGDQPFRTRLWTVGHTRLPVELVSQPIMQKGKTYQGIAIRDLSDRALAEARTEHRAHRDVATGLHSRAGFEVALAHLLRRGEDNRFALISLELAGVVPTETLARAVADHVADGAALAIDMVLRQGDLFARLGDGTFALLRPLKSASREAEAERLCEGIRHALDGGRVQGVSIAGIGIAFYPEHGQDGETLLAHAGAALQEAKSEGAGHCQFYAPELAEKQREQRELEQDLRGALARDEFKLHYQPQIDRHGRNVTGFEALLRWRRKGALVPPDQFIPLAEQCGLIQRIGEWVLRRACADAATWQDGLTVAVNISAVQLCAGDLVDVVEAALAESGLAPARLELEITETALMRNPHLALAAMSRLNDLGVKLAMDDFGIGFSSLSMLRSLPFNRIKIDKFFVRNVDADEQLGTMLKAMLNMAHGLRLPVVAEGVETAEEMAFLTRADAGVELQGYLFAKPMEIDRFVDAKGALKPGSVYLPGKRVPAAQALSWEGDIVFA